MRNRISLSVVISLFFLSAVLPGKADAQSSIFEKGFSKKPEARYVSGEIIVKFKPGITDEIIRGLTQRNGCSILSTSRFADFKRLRIPTGKTVEQIIGIYSRNPNVKYAEPNYVAYAFLEPNDEFYQYQWHLDNTDYGGINMEAAWDLQTEHLDVIVAVIDTGAAYENYINFVQAPDLANTSFVAGYDFVNNDTHPNDDEGHGTHVTGTIAQSTNNNIGTAGIAFDCSIMPIKVLDKTGSGTYANIAEGIYFAADNGVKVINMSLGGSASSITLEEAVAYAYGQGVTIVCASGNDGSDTTISYPAAYDAYCIAVGATRYDEAVAYYSNGGPSLDLTAPGGDLNVDQNGDGYGDGVLQQTFGNNPRDFGYWFYQGTSMAAPHVAGVAALLIANVVAVTPDDVREALQSTAEDKGDSGWDSAYGWGIVDAYAALNYTQGTNNPPVADANGPYTGTEDIGVDFNGSGSSDQDGDPLTYRWDFGDGSTGAGVNPTHAYTAGGEYTVTLVVNDGRADSTTDTTTADIAEVNDSPVADAGLDQTALMDETVTFEGSSSYDIDGNITIFDWDFGDGITGSGITTSHAYSVAGTYYVTLTVTDDGGLTGTDTAQITVTEEASNVMHVASIDISLKTAGINTSALATVTIVDADGFLVEGATVYGSWSGATSDTDSGVTVNGQVIVESDKVKRAASGAIFTFTVDDVTKNGWEYDSVANVETNVSITVQ